MQIKKLNEAFTNMYKVNETLPKNIFEELDTIDDEVEVVDDNGKKLDTKETEEVELTEDRHHKETEEEKKENNLIHSAMRKKKVDQTKDEKEVLDKYRIDTNYKNATADVKLRGKRVDVHQYPFTKSDGKFNIVDYINTERSGDRDYARKIANRGADVRSWGDSRDFNTEERTHLNRKSPERTELDWAVNDRRRDKANLADVDSAFERDVRNALEHRDRDKVYYGKRVDTDNRDIKRVLDSKRAEVDEKRKQRGMSVAESVKQARVNRAKTLHESIQRRKRITESLKRKAIANRVSNKKHIAESVAPRAKKHALTESAKARVTRRSRK